MMTASSTSTTGRPAIYGSKQRTAATAPSYCGSIVNCCLSSRTYLGRQTNSLSPDLSSGREGETRPRETRMDKKQADLMWVHRMAIGNTPLDPDEASKQMAEYRQHRRYCIEQYGTQTTFRAESYGVASTGDGSA